MPCFLPGDRLPPDDRAFGQFNGRTGENAFDKRRDDMLVYAASKYFLVVARAVPDAPEVIPRVAANMDGIEGANRASTVLRSTAVNPLYGDRERVNDVVNVSPEFGKWSKGHVADRVGEVRCLTSDLTGAHGARAQRARTHLCVCVAGLVRSRLHD